MYGEGCTGSSGPLQERRKRLPWEEAEPPHTNTHTRGGSAKKGRRVRPRGGLGLGPSVPRSRRRAGGSLQGNMCRGRRPPRGAGWRAGPPRGVWRARGCLPARETAALSRRTHPGCRRNRPSCGGEKAPGSGLSGEGTSLSQATARPTRSLTRSLSRPLASPPGPASVARTPRGSPPPAASLSG